MMHRYLQVVGLTYYAEVLALMCRIIESPNYLSVPLNDANPTESNVDYVFAVVARHYKAAFPHLTESVTCSCLNDV